MEKDPFAFDVQLNTEAEERDYHNRNKDPNKTRFGVVDDICQDLLLQVRIDRIVHGTETKDGSPATLVVFGFRFHGIDEKRRFQQAITTITFQDKQKRGDDFDPEIVALWPNGDYTLGQPTEIAAEDTQGGDASANVTAGNGVQGGGQVAYRWERKQSYKKSDRTTLTGSIILDMSVRDYGSNNAVRLTTSENVTAKTGLITDSRVAVLLKRKTINDHFVCRVEIKAKAHFMYNFVQGVRPLLGLSPPNDPVIFKPGEQYLRAATLAGLLETKLAEKIDENNLNATKLDGLAGVLGTTVLATTV